MKGRLPLLQYTGDWDLEWDGFPSFANCGSPHLDFECLFGGARELLDVPDHFLLTCIVLRGLGIHA